MPSAPSACPRTSRARSSSAGASKEKQGEATDWTIKDACNHGASLTSDELGFSQDLFPLLSKKLGEAAFGQAYSEHEMEFEIPEASNDFPHPKAYEPPPEASTTATASSNTGVIVQTPNKARQSIDVKVVPLP